MKASAAIAFHPEICACLTTINARFKTTKNKLADAISLRKSLEQDLNKMGYEQPDTKKFKDLASQLVVVQNRIKGLRADVKSVADYLSDVTEEGSQGRNIDVGTYTRKILEDLESGVRRGADDAGGEGEDGDETARLEFEDSDNAEAGVSPVAGRIGEKNAAAKQAERADGDRPKFSAAALEASPAFDAVKIDTFSFSSGDKGRLKDAGLLTLQDLATFLRDGGDYAAVVGAGGKPDFFVAEMARLRKQHAQGNGKKSTKKPSKSKA